MLCFVWLLAASAGAIALLKYESTAGKIGRIPEHWPEGTSISLDRRHPTLLMFAHPKCPCTRASLEELNRILARCGETVTVRILFFKPSNPSAEWEQTASLHRTAAAIPGVEVMDDPDCALALKFGAETSGCVALYTPQGELLFRGGITGSRGHVGDNAGQTALVSLLEGRKTNLKQTDVYGCSLVDAFCSKENVP